MRKAIVTRTIASTEVTVMGVNTETAEVENKTYNLSGVYSNDKKLLKAVKSAFETDTFKVVQIVDSEQVSRLYGMYENDFLSNAMELDPETRKPLYSEE